MRFRLPIPLAAAVLLMVSCAGRMTAPSAVEGMWQLDLLEKTTIDQMREMGCELKQEDIFDPDGRGIAYAVVSLGGGTGSFVSPKGLILTNHHVVFGALQRASDPDHNYIEDGLNAASYGEEIPAEGYRASVLLSIEDVTERVQGAVSEGMSGIERYEAIEMRIKEIVKEAEEGRDVRCDVADFYEGMQYKLFTYFTIKDIRLVYAPPQSIGNYGGDIDNWMWPRHTGDFSFFRAYVAPDGSSAEYTEENVPYEPAVYLPISSKGFKDGDFTMIIGFPGMTMRYRSSYSIDHHQNFNYPNRIKMFGDLVGIFQDAAGADESVAIKVATMDQRLNNAMKNYEGQLEGFRKAGLLERKLKEEEEFEAWLDENGAMKEKYGDILPAIAMLYEDIKKRRDKGLITNFVGFGCQMMRAASLLNRWSEEKSKEDIEREPGYQERDVPQLKLGLEMIERSYDMETDRKVLKYFMMRALELPADQRFVVVDEMLESIGAGTAEAGIDSILDGLYSGTKLHLTDERLRMFDLSREELLNEGDPFIEFAVKVREEIKVMEDEDKEFSGAITALRPRLIEAYREWKGGTLYPDANGTMRLTYGTVKGYVPRDAVSYYYITALGGVIEKHTGEDPFNCPDKLISLHRDGDFGVYMDSHIGDVPVDFLATTDITGGNSGSPIMNGRGEVIGAAFDGNWESISSDYLFNEELTRTIAVDARYILFVLDKFSAASRVLDEITVH